MLYLHNGHDLAFTPTLRFRSIDDGRTWQRLDETVPRCAWAHSFADGELFEIDNYGLAVPGSPDETVFYGAWSRPSVPDDVPRREMVRVHFHDLAAFPLKEWLNGNPTMPWWPQWREVYKLDRIDFDRISFRGPFFTSMIALDSSRLMALGYAQHNNGKWITMPFESADRGRTWRQVGTITDLANNQPITNEASLVRLGDGRLFSVLRTEAPLVQSWSNDEGRTWSQPQPLQVIDEPHKPAHVWPVLRLMGNGCLVLAYGRPGKNLLIDPTGTSTAWQSRLDLHAWELQTQEIMGVPESQRLRGVVGKPLDETLDRYHDSGDYLGLVADGPDELLVTYDVQDYLEHWNARPFSGVRMLRVRIQS